MANLFSNDGTQADDKEAFAKCMATMEVLIEEMVASGRMPNASLYDMQTKNEKEHYERHLRFKKAAYKNTRMLLSNVHKFKKLKEEWTLELASEVDMPLPINVKLLEETVRDIIEFEKPGYQRLRQIVVRINDTRSKLSVIQNSLNILKDRSEGTYDYFLIKNAFLDTSNKRSSDEQLIAMAEKYGIKLAESTYYDHLKKAVEELSLIAWGGKTDEDRLMNMFASILYASGEIFDMEKSGMGYGKN